jgi:DNA ligase-1
MLLAAVVETSRRVAETTKRLEKIDLLARLLKQLHPEEVEIVVAFLTGRTRQGGIGIGYGTIRDAKGSPAPEPSLEVAEIDRTFESTTKIQGSGSQRQRLQLLSGMFARATEPEQQFLIGLLMGELRQGALEGIMVDAVAKASGIPADRVRRAGMLAGDIPVVARARIEK